MGAIIGIPLGYIMWAIYSVCKNYGLSLVIFTIISRLVQIPVSVKQQKSMAAMTAFQPKLDKLKKQYANNPQKLQEEQMKLYAEEDINPMASCLPLIFTMVFFYGIFDVVNKPLTHILHISNNAIEEMKKAAASMFEGNAGFSSRPQIYIIQALKNDPTIFDGVENVTSEVISKIQSFDNMLFGFIDVGAVPSSVFAEGHVWTAASTGLIMIPVITAVIQIIQTVYSTVRQKKMNPEAASQMAGMNLMLYLMPILFISAVYASPAGLGFYWICSSFVGLIQMIILNKVFTPEYVAKLVEKDKLKNKNKKRSSFTQKYQELLKEQMEQQSQQAQQVQQAGRSSARSSRSSDTGEDIKISRSQIKEYESQIIAEARRKQAEKYGDPNAANNKDQRQETERK